jgi:hypothetical protein
MDLLVLYSWLILPVAAVSGCILFGQIAHVASTLHGLAADRRYFRHLVAVRNRAHDDTSNNRDTTRMTALALGFDYVDAYRTYRRSRRHLRIDLWRAPDRSTLALTSSARALWGTRYRTAFVSVLDDGTRITTSDSFDEGDPLGLKGELIRHGLSFRELYIVHRKRIAQSRRDADVIGSTNPLSVIEDLDRSRVQQLADAGLARYRDEVQISWSYTLRGACDVYYRARPRQLREYHAYRAAEAETAE